MVDPMATARGRVLISVAAVVLAAIAVPVFASASSSRALGSEARSLYALSCPSTTQCTALDGAGREITFDPTSPPRHVSRHKALRYSHNLSCPSITFCVAEDGLNPEHGVAFVPTSGRVLNRFTFSEAKAGQVIGWKALTCVSAGQCTTVSYEGIELTFDPRTGGTISNATLPHSSEGLSSVTCPSPTQCTAIFDDSTGTLQGYEVTFDPTTGVPNAAGAAVVDWTGLQRLACPSTTQSRSTPPRANKRAPAWSPFSKVTGASSGRCHVRRSTFASPPMHSDRKCRSTRTQERAVAPTRSVRPRGTRARARR
jgi:hypothetical protein